MDDADPHIEVSVVYLGERRRFLKTLTVRSGVAVDKVLEQAGFWDAYPEFSRGSVAVGIFGKPVSLDDVPGPGDRIEVYRSLKVDPRKARRQRAGGA